MPGIWGFSTSRWEKVRRRVGDTLDPAPRCWMFRYDDGGMERSPLQKGAAHLRNRHKITDSLAFPLGPDRVVPFSVKPVGLELDLRHLVVGHDDAHRVGVAIDL